MTIGLRVSLELPDVIFKRYKREIELLIEKEQIEAIKKWLKSVLSRTPTYTGTARGTYVGVGRIVGKSVRRGKVKGRTDPKKKKFFVYRNRKFPLGFKEGDQYSDEDISKKISKNQMLFRFEFHQSLIYVLWNEISPGPVWFPFKTPPPWFARELARKSFRNYVNKNIRKKLLKITPFGKKKFFRG